MATHEEEGLMDTNRHIGQSSRRQSQADRTNTSRPETGRGGYVQPWTALRGPSLAGRSRARLLDEDLGFFPGIVS